MPRAGRRPATRAPASAGPASFWTPRARQAGPDGAPRQSAQSAVFPRRYRTGGSGAASTRHPLGVETTGPRPTPRRPPAMVRGGRADPPEPAPAPPSAPDDASASHGCPVRPASGGPAFARRHARSVAAACRARPATRSKRGSFMGPPCDPGTGGRTVWDAVRVRGTRGDRCGPRVQRVHASPAPCGSAPRTPGEPVQGPRECHPALRVGAGNRVRLDDTSVRPLKGRDGVLCPCSRRRDGASGTEYRP